MSYYNPSYSQTIAMSRGRGGYSPRGSSYRGSRGPRGGYSSRGFSSFNESRGSRYPSNDRYSGPKRYDEFRKPSPSFREGGYHGRDHSSPERKKQRTEGYSSRHDSSYGGSSSYGGGRYESSYSGRRSIGERATSSPYPSRREEFRKPSGPPQSRGRIFRGRGRSSRGIRMPERSGPPRRRILSSRSYGIMRRPPLIRSRTDYIRRLKMSQLRRDIAGRPKSDSEDEEKKDSDKGETEPEVETNETEEKDTSKTEEKAKSVNGEETKRKFIKLVCPHCKIKCQTFRMYEIHLSGRTHMITMRRLALKQRGVLAKMRQEQRSKQNELEKSEEDLQDKTNFCQLCKLNYKQRKTIHQASDGHKAMKKFLMPVCKVCSVSLKSPMIYENHLCSIQHIKKQQRSEPDQTEESGGDEDLDNFTTIDSVGDQEEDGEEKKEESKEIVNVGIEKIRKVESYYCDLCHIYLPRCDESDVQRTLSKHCKIRFHMQRYVRYKENKDLEKKAEMLQRKETAEKESKKSKDDEEIEKSETTDGETSNVKTEGEDLNKSNDDDKLWDDVDKDIGDILAEAEDDEEEETNVKGKERFDRFKLSDKAKKGNAQPEVSNGQTEEVKEEK